MKNTLTTIILTKNQVSPITPLVAESRQHGEVLVWDDFSDDGAPKLASGPGVRVLQHALNNNFAAHRNAALIKVQTEWVFFLDADERPQPGFWIELLEKIQTSSAVAITIPRRTFFMGRWLRYGETGQSRIVRAARTEAGQGRWQRPVHEVWQIPGELDHLQHALNHYSAPTLTGFLQKLNRYAALEVASRPPTSRLTTLGQFLLYPTAKFFLNYFLRLGFLDGFPGLSLAFLMSYYSAILRVYLYEAHTH